MTSKNHDEWWTVDSLYAYAYLPNNLPVGLILGCAMHWKVCVDVLTGILVSWCGTRIRIKPQQVNLQGRQTAGEVHFYIRRQFGQMKISESDPNSTASNIQADGSRWTQVVSWRSYNSENGLAEVDQSRIFSCIVKDTNRAVGQLDVFGQLEVRNKVNGANPNNRTMRSARKDTLRWCFNKRMSITESKRKHFNRKVSLWKELLGMKNGSTGVLSEFWFSLRYIARQCMSWYGKPKHHLFRTRHYKNGLA